MYPLSLKGDYCKVANMQFRLHFAVAHLLFFCTHTIQKFCKPATRLHYSKACLKWPLSKRKKMGFMTNYRLMQVKRIARCSHWSILQILLTFIRLPFVIKIFVLSIFEWPLRTGFTVFTMPNGLSKQVRNTVMLYNAVPL